MTGISIHLLTAVMQAAGSWKYYLWLTMKGLAQKDKLSWGKRGEHLVVFQFILFFTFIFLPVFPDVVDAGPFRKLVFVRWTILIATWVPAFFLECSACTILKNILLLYPIRLSTTKLLPQESTLMCAIHFTAANFLLLWGGASLPWVFPTFF